MLENEPNGTTEAADPAATAPPKQAAKKTTRKRTTKKVAAQTPVETAEATAPAKKTTAKRTVKKAAAKRPAKKTAAAAAQDQLPETEPAAETPAPAKKTTTRKRTSKKAAAAPQPDLLTVDTPVAEAPVAAAPVETPAESVEAPAEGGQRRTRRRAPAAAAVLFQAPTEVPSAAGPVEAPAEAAADEQPTSTSTRRRRSRRSRDAEEVAGTTEPAVAEPAVDRAADTQETQDTEDAASADVEETDGEEGGEGARRRRRRRGGRRRRKPGDAEGSDDTADEQAEDETDDSDEHREQHEDADGEHEQGGESEDETEGSASSSRRRRRRRRRKGEEGAGAPDDPDETVVRVREPRSKNTANEITAVEGSTRLEAKKQRRREGRAAGRRRAPIVTEAEFLARRESVERTMVIRARGDLTQIAVSEDNVLVEHYVAQEEQVSLIGNVYLGRVQNVLPSMEAAFIDIGKGRNAVLYAGEVDWATLGGANGPRKIELVLKSGQSVLVQVTKDPIGHKGARLTNQISLPGRYVVYVPRGGNGGISRKLPDTERNRLKGILKDIVPDEAGVIVRTAAEGASEEELTADVSRLQTYWDDIDKLSKNGQSPQLLYGEPDLLIRVVRDLFTEDFAKLVISGDQAYDQVKEYVSYVAPHLADRVEKWTGDGDVFSNYRIDEQIKKALDRKVWLPSGGSLIIDRTEAMTVVDVNTGKFTGSGGNLEETVTKNNLEAAEEIVRQLRLRDIGGIIVIDFIDMVLELNRDLVLRRLVECLGRDRTKHQVAEVTSLGLVQMTRKRIGTGLLEAFSENCDHCGGRGLILHDEPKESRRRQDDGRNRGQQGGNEQKSSEQAADGEGAKKSSRSRSRGKGRGRGEGADEQPDVAETPNDAAKRLAEIAAASAVATGDKAEPEHVEPEAEHAEAEPQEQDKAGQNGRSGTTRRRRSNRGRSTATSPGTSTEGDAGNSGADQSVSTQELASTPV